MYSTLPSMTWLVHPEITDKFVITVRTQAEENSKAQRKQSGRGAAEQVGGSELVRAKKERVEPAPC